MSVFKCKMCGGALDVMPGSSVATCSYCGSVQTLPKSYDDEIRNLFNRANDYRMGNEFDKALATYEGILDKDNTIAEAHWGCLISKYGIEYVKDPRSGNIVPTCHRVQRSSILADVDYMRALEYADISSRSIYEKEAYEISEIQKRILAVANQEEEYDIFICYKETDEYGNRTMDSVLAQDLYVRLTEDEHYKVFFARITLEDKLGMEYEPYIFAALNSAKVMLVVGTRPEHFNAIWVRNEWSRYLALLKNDRSKLIVPCYRDMDPYSLPNELALFQSQDMGKIGFVQDLVRGIKKVIVKETPVQVAPVQVAPIQTVASVRGASQRVSAAPLTGVDAVAHQLISEGYTESRKIAAIKELRERTGLGLADAKSAMDRAFATYAQGSAPVAQQVVSPVVQQVSSPVARQATSPVAQQTVPPAVPVVAYHVVINGQAAGPFDMAGLSRLVSMGSLTVNSYVWKAGMPNWVLASTVSELQSLFTNAVPPFPPMR